MLNQFHINGAQPLLESRVQDMITNANITLRDILLAEIRLVRGTANVSEQCTSQVSATETWPTGTLVDGHMQWSWGGRIHMVPKGWSLPKGNVSMLFNLWVKGNSALHLQPYCFLKGWDFQATEEKTGVNLPMVLSAAARKKALDTTPATWRSYLSQATDVMIVIEDECGMTFQRLAALSAQDREAKFISAFQALCRKLHPGLPDEQLDAKRLHENSYMTIYSALSKKQMLCKSLGKRKQRDGEDLEHDSEEEEQGRRSKSKETRSTSRRSKSTVSEDLE